MGQLLGPFAMSLTTTSSEFTAVQDVASTVTFTPLMSFKVPINTVWVFRASTQFTAQQHYWGQALVTTASANPAVSSNTQTQLERRDASGSIILAIFDRASAGEVPSPTTSSKTSLRYFQNTIKLNQNEYLYVSVQSVASQTVASSGSLSQLLLKGERWVLA